jgi:serine protease Do
MHTDYSLFRSAFLFISLLGCCGKTAIANDIVPQGRTEPTIEKAISSVYPALVQIYVLTLKYEDGRERKSQAAGSGAIITPEGLVVTNHHVVGRAATIKCVLSTGEEIDASLVGTDPLGDIAVVKLDLSSRRAGAPPLAFARFGDSDELKVGDPVLAMGCPRALSQSVTRGIVSNKDMTIPSILNRKLELEGEDVGSLVKWIGHDAQIFPGNSGGPLVNLRGEIVGINEIELGLGGAIPSNIAKAISQELISQGRVRRAWIGAEFQPQLKSALDAVVPGVLVSGVLPDSPAKRAGIKAGDIVSLVDGQAVNVRFQQEMPAFTQSIASKDIGKPIELKIVRDHRELTLSVLAELRDEAKAKDVEAKDWGLTVRRLSLFETKELGRTDRKGVLVGSVRSGGPADQSQPTLDVNDVITHVNGKSIEDIDSFIKITAEVTREKTEPVPVLVAFERRGDRELTVVNIGIRRSQAPPAEVEKAWLPIAYRVLSNKLAATLNLKGVKGVRVIQVYPDSVAQTAGFQVGDIITHINDRLIEASESQDSRIFETMLRTYSAGTKAEFAVIRDGQNIKIASALISAPKAERELNTYDDIVLEFKARDIAFLDRIQRRWGKEETGALVTETDQGGWASVAGLRADDLIQAVDGHPVSDVKELKSALSATYQKQPRHIAFLVRRGIHTLFIELEPKWPVKK